MTRDELVDRIGSKLPPGEKSVNENNRENNARGNNFPPAPWLKPVASYVRSQPREYQVMRFG
jgi:hypothetical protein